MSNQPHDSSLHSRENQDEASTGSPSSSRLQAQQKTKKKKRKKGKEEQRTNKAADTTESPMSIEDGDQAEKR